MSPRRSLNEVIQKKVVALSEETSAQVAARAMRSQQVGCILVTNGKGRLAGILTDRDLACRWIADDSKNERARLADLMTRDVIVAEDTDGLERIVSLMEEHGVRRIPILSHFSSARQIAGIVTFDDLVAGQWVDATRLSRIIRRQLGRLLTDQNQPQRMRRQIRADARALQTLDDFYRRIHGLTGLQVELVPRVSQLILGMLIMRIARPAAEHFMAQLPRLLRESLKELPAGPARGITARRIVEEMVSRYGFDERFARLVLAHFMAALKEIFGPAQLWQLRSQLSGDFAEVFEAQIQAKQPETLLLKGTGMKLTSPAFDQGGVIPRKFSGEGEERSPMLEWSGVPVDAKEFAVICEDPDAPSAQPYVHWVVYGIPATVTQLPEGIPAVEKIEVPVRLRQGENSAGTLGYIGPMPPRGHGWHRYFFHLFAVDKEITLPPGASAAQLRQELEGHVISESVIMGRYQRKVGGRAA